MLGWLLGPRTLHEAAARGNLRAVRRLLAMGAEVDAVDDRGRTPLDVTCAYGFEPSGILKLFLPEPSPRPFEIRERIAEALLAAGADARTRREDPEAGVHFTCLDIATSTRAAYKVGIIRRLLEAGADPDAEGPYGHTPFFNVVRDGHEELGELFVRHGATENDKIRELRARRRWHEELVASIDPTADLRRPRPEGDFAYPWDFIEPILVPLQIARRLATERGCTLNLTPGQRMLLTVLDLNAQVCNGGFGQYFFNSYGDDALVALEDLQRLGAPRSRALLAEAIALLGADPYPVDADERSQALDRMPADAERAMGELGSRYHASGEEIMELCVAYVEAHPDEFFRG